MHIVRTQVFDHFPQTPFVHIVLRMHNLWASFDLLQLAYLRTIDIALDVVSEYPPP